MKGHEEYKVLCSLAAAGEILPDDLQELRQHLQECGDCRILLSDLVQVSAQALPVLVDHDRSSPVGMRARFIERARLEGVPVRSSQSLLTRVSSFSRPQLAWAGIVATGIMTGIMMWFGVSQFRNAHRVSFGQVTHEHSVPGPTTAEFRTTDGQAATLSSESEAVSRLRVELAKEQSRGRDRERQIANIEHDRAAAHEQNVELVAKLTALQSEVADLSEARKKVESIQSAEVDRIAVLAERQVQIEKLRAEISERDAELKRDRELLAASGQARDLIVARNLHIVDVHDSNGLGERQRAFGRIFYSEGKSLVFYAYDLESPAKGDTRVSFHVWGTRLGDQARLRNLGILRAEDTGAGRWVLTCDDPEVLSKINTVFVTAESAHKNNVDQPTGKRILYAFLDGRPNHP